MFVELSVQNRVGSSVVGLANVPGNSHHGRKRHEEIQRADIENRIKCLEHVELRPSDSAEGVFGLGDEQPIDEMKDHQEASTNRGRNLPSKGTHRFNISGVEGFNLEGKVVPLLEVLELLFRCNGVSRVQEGGTSS